jgi:hypothetical protein
LFISIFIRNLYLGPGEQGAGFILSAEENNSNKKSALFGQNGFNALASDKISLERSLNDIRHPGYAIKQETLF